MRILGVDFDHIVEKSPDKFTLWRVGLRGPHYIALTHNYYDRPYRWRFTVCVNAHERMLVWYVEKHNPGDG